MPQAFQQNQQVKIRTSVLVFIKGSSAPLVLYVENPLELYSEIMSIMKSGQVVNKLIEKNTLGPLKKVCINISEISAIALQEEPYVT